MESYLENATREFLRLKRLADGALAQMSDEGFFHALGQSETSAAIVVKHLAGNMLSRWRDFLTTDGEKPDRDRDSEFVITSADSRAALSDRWEQGWRTLFDALDPLTDDDLGLSVTIRGEPLSVLQAVGRQLTHYAYHVGQIVLLAKLAAGPDWKTLSIAKGASRRFNAAPDKYVEGPET
jgi:hypothetical protein